MQWLVDLANKHPTDFKLLVAALVCLALYVACALTAAFVRWVTKPYVPSPAVAGLIANLTKADPDDWKPLPSDLLGSFAAGLLHAASGTTLRWRRDSYDNLLLQFGFHRNVWIPVESLDARLIHAAVQLMAIRRLDCSKPAAKDDKKPLELLLTAEELPKTLE